jgi:hypothetical protein
LFEEGGKPHGWVALRLAFLAAPKKAHPKPRVEPARHPRLHNVLCVSGGSLTEARHGPAPTLFAGDMTAHKIVKPAGQEADELELKVAGELYNLEVGKARGEAARVASAHEAGGAQRAPCCPLARTDQATGSLRRT